MYGKDEEDAAREGTNSKCVITGMANYMYLVTKGGVICDVVKCENGMMSIIETKKCQWCEMWCEVPEGSNKSTCINCVDKEVLATEYATKEFIDYCKGVIVELAKRKIYCNLKDGTIEECDEWYSYCERNGYECVRLTKLELQLINGKLDNQWEESLEMWSCVIKATT